MKLIPLATERRSGIDRRNPADVARYKAETEARKLELHAQRLIDDALEPVEPVRGRFEDYVTATFGEETP